MFETSANDELRLWVATIGDDPLDEHYRGVIRIWDRLAQVSPVSGQPSVFILYLTPGAAARPPAIWRQRFAEAEKKSHGKRVAFVLVTDSALVRGMRTAVTWIAPPPPGFDVGSVATMEEALLWIEERRGGQSSTLRSLYLDVEAKARASGRSPIGNKQ